MRDCTSGRPHVKFRPPLPPKPPGNTLQALSLTTALLHLNGQQNMPRNMLKNCLGRLAVLGSVHREVGVEVFVTYT